MQGMAYSVINRHNNQWTWYYDLSLTLHSLLNMSTYNMLLNIMTHEPATLVSYHWKAVPGTRGVKDLLEPLEATLWHTANASTLHVSNPAASLPAVARAQPQGLINRKGPRVQGKLMVTQDSPGASQVSAQPIRTEIKAALSPKLAHSSVTNISRVNLAKALCSRAWGFGSDLGPKLGLSWQFIWFSQLQFPSGESGGKIP